MGDIGAQEDGAWVEATSDMWGVVKNEEVQKHGPSFGGEALFQQLQEASKAEAERRYARWTGLRSRDEGVGRAGSCSWESLGEGEWPWEGQGNFGDDGGRDDVGGWLEHGRDGGPRVLGDAGRGCRRVGVG